MLIFSLLERFDLWYQALVVADVALAALIYSWVIRRYPRDDTAVVCAGALYFGTGVFFLNWFATFEDKIFYAILCLTLMHLLLADVGLKRSTTALAVGFVLGISTAFSGSGPVQALVLAIASFRHKSGQKHWWRMATLATVVAGAVIITSHLCFYPEWLAAYQRRAERYDLSPTFLSPFQFLDALGIYHPWEVWCVIAALLVLACWKAASGTDPFVGLVLATFATTGVRPESSYDILIVTLLLATLLMLNNRAVSLTVVLLSAGVAIRVGYNDHPDLLRLSLMWLPLAVAIGWLILRDLYQNLSNSITWFRTRKDVKNLCLDRNFGGAATLEPVHPRREG